MAMKFKTRKRLAILVLLVGLPLYIVLAVTLVAMLPPMHKLVELVLYIALGMAWALPLKPLFKGVGRPDPDDPDAGQQG